MSYPGSADLDQKVQQRILTAFGESVRLYREGHPEECRTILRSILEVDPRFTPAQRLDDAIARGAQVDLAQLLAELTAAAPVKADEIVARAHQALERRDFQGAVTLAQSVLRELPGHGEARQIVLDAQARRRAESEVETNLARAEEALTAGMLIEATGFVKMALAADPEHPRLIELTERIKEAALQPPNRGEAGPELEFEFETYQPEPEPEPEPPAPGESPAAHVPAEASPDDVMLPAWMEAGGGAAPESPSPPPMATPVPALAAPPEPTAPPVFSAPPLAPRPAIAPAPPQPPPPSAAAPPSRPPSTPPPLGLTPGPAAAPGLGPPGGAPPAAAPAPPEDEALPLFSFDEPAAKMQFGPPAGAPAGQVSAPPPGELDEAGRKVAELLEDGQRAFDAGDYQSAIDTWSRIYLVDAANVEAERRIDQARRRREEHERRAEHRFYEARDAFEHGKREEARALCLEVLEMLPQHLEAHDLLSRLDTPAAPPPPPSEAAGDVDLFKDDFVPAKLSASGEIAIAAVKPPPAPKRERAAARAARRPGAAGRRVPVSVPLFAGIGGMVIVLALVGVLLRGSLFSGSSAAVSKAIAEAEQLAAAGKLQEAITLLQNVEAEGEAANQLTQKSLEYARKLKAAGKPAPAAAVTEARNEIAAGRRVKAYQVVRDGLAKVPGDKELVEIQSELVAYAPAIAPLADALAAGKWEAVRLYAQQVLDLRPADAEVRRLWEVATFNAAVTQLRAYQVASANRLLKELAARGDDPEVRRLVELSGSYLSRPVDPRYQIFVGAIVLRAP